MNCVLYWIVALCCVLSVNTFPQKGRRPEYVECASSSECSFDSCCVLGPGRYSIPQCQKKLQLHQVCTPAVNDNFKTTVTYPDGGEVSLVNVHLSICPCAYGLICDPRSGRCEDYDTMVEINEILKEHEAHVYKDTD